MADPATGTVQQVQIVDGRWLHLRGASYSPVFQDRMDFYRQLAQALEKGDMPATMLPAQASSKGPADQELSDGAGNFRPSETRSEN